MTSNRQSRTAFITPPPRPRAVSRRIRALATLTSKREGVERIVRSNVEAIVARQQSLEVAQTGHGFLGPAAGEQRLAVVAAETVQPIVALGPDDPDNGVRPPVRGRDDRRAFTRQR